jgi:heterodisulfide reductase subunit A-like polyferredoxin
VVEVAYIREQCSWVHLHKKAAGTHKALELIQMGIAIQFHLIKPDPNLLQTEKAYPTAHPLTQAT